MFGGGNVQRRKLRAPPGGAEVLGPEVDDTKLDQASATLRPRAEPPGVAAGLQTAGGSEGSGGGLAALAWNFDVADRAARRAPPSGLAAPRRRGSKKNRRDFRHFLHLPTCTEQTRGCRSFAFQ